MGFLLIAVLTMQEGFGQTKAGYQTSVMQHFDSMEDCRFAADQLRSTHKAANWAPNYSKGQIRCVDMKNKTEQIITSYSF